MRNADAVDDAGFRANFGNAEPPAELLDLFARQARLRVAPPVELGAEEGAAEAWFDGDSDKAKQFVVFGHSPDGGLVAFWCYEQRPLDRAPIVYLDSEGDTSGVIARNASELASLVATGESLYELLRGRRDARPVDMAELGLEPASDPLAVVRSAQAEHPDLDALIERWVDER